MRKKLINLISRIVVPYFAEQIADLLIAHGVVFAVSGEWVVCGDGENVPWMCSHCGKTTDHKYKNMYGKFCPNCGARMDGADQ